jgi:hypothetical protein
MGLVTESKQLEKKIDRSDDIYQHLVGLNPAFYRVTTCFCAVRGGIYQYLTPSKSLVSNPVNFLIRATEPI